MENLEKLSPNAWRTLRKIAQENQSKLIYTFFLIALENIVFLIYPIFAGISVNAILAGELWKALSYAVVVLVAWGIGATRRVVDTKTFARIYAEMAVPIILNQRQLGEDNSTIVARVRLSREFVNFFEEHLPMFITSLISMIGAVVMLIFIEFWVGIASLVIMLIFMVFLPNFVKKTDDLYFQLNNQLEKEVDYISEDQEQGLKTHYGIMARLRISISNREALGYLWVGILASFLFAFVITMLTIDANKDAGHISAVMTYLWMFAISLDDSPRLIEQFSKLKDIGKRVDV